MNSSSEHARLVSSPDTPTWKALAFLLGLFAVVVGACSVYAAVLAGVYTVSIGAFGAFALLACAIIVAVLCARKPHVAQGLEALPWFRIYLVAQIASIPALLTLGYLFTGSVGTDYQELADMATAAVQGEPNPHIDKYGAYPNNHLLLMFMIVLFGAIHAIDPAAGQAQFMWWHVVINIVLIEAAFACVAWAVRLLWGRRRGGIAGILMVTCSPIWLNCSNPYSDTSALFFIALAALLTSLFLTAEKDSPIRRIAALVGLGLVCAVGFKFKATVAVLAVAFSLVALLMLNLKRALASIAIVALAAIVAISGCNAFVEAVRPESMPYGAQEQDRWQFPYVHWTMMSMNPKGDGTYKAKDYDFTSSFESYSEKQEACAEQLNKRLEKLGVGGTLYRIGVQKPADLLRSGAFVKNEVPARWVDTQSTTGRLFAAYLNYAQGYHGAMLGLVALCAFALARNRKHAAAVVAAMRKDPTSHEARQLFMLLFAMAALFGFMLFICGFWEAKARYPVHFLPLFLILEADGLSYAWRIAKNSRRKQGYDKATESGS